MAQPVPATPHEHFAFAKHLTAEVRVEEFIAGKGVVVRWERIRKQNHWLDGLYNACVAGHGCGVRLVDERPPERPAPPPTPPEEIAEFGGNKPWIDREEARGWGGASIIISGGDLVADANLLV